MKQGAALTRPALRYYGGKWNLAPWIIEHFPRHVGYVEPFAGAASVLVRKEPSAIEVYNDADGEVVNFFRVLREQPDVLVRALALTPYAREELEISLEPLAEDPVERARRLFVRCWFARGGARNTWRPGWRFQRADVSRRAITEDWGDVGRLFAIAERFKGVQIEHAPALEVIRRFDGPATLFYCDPPYVASTRSERWGANGYHTEMTDEDHRQLGRLLNEIQGMAVVSGYDNPLYRELFEGWESVTRGTYTEGSAMDGRPRRVEVLWISPKAQALARQGRLSAAWT